MSPAPKTTPDGSAPTTKVERFDIALSRKLAAHRDHPAVRALGTACQVGDQGPLLAISAGVVAIGLLASRPPLVRTGVGMLAALATATALKSVAKRLVSRTRPRVLLDHGGYEVRPLGPQEGPWHSFPSGHTAGSLAVARAIARVHGDAAIPAYAAAGVIGLAQIPCGRHFPADVAAGAVTGLVAEAISERVVAGTMTWAAAVRERRDAELRREEVAWVDHPSSGPGNRTSPGPDRSRSPA